MQNKSQIHIRVGYIEAIRAKKEILLCEAGLLKIIKKIREYSSLRNQEFTCKNRIKKALIESKLTIAKIEQDFPKQREIDIETGIKINEEKNLRRLESDKSLSKETISEIRKKEENRKKIKQKEKKKNIEIELELEDIKSKLEHLG